MLIKNSSVLHNLLFIWFQLTTLVESQDLQTLKLVQVLFRHGDRYPIWNYPNDPYNHEPLFSPHNMGQLTMDGKRQHFELGRFLRRRYDGFISRSYSADEIFILSSDMDRTIMSAQMNLAGLFEPQNLTGNWNPAIDWTPVPIRTIPSSTDKLLGMRQPCPRLKVVAAEITRSATFQAVEEQHRQFLNYLQIHTGMKGDFSLSNAATVRDILLTEHLHNYSLPAWAHGKMDYLTHLTGLDMMFRTITDEAKRLRAGPLLHQILESMETASKKFLMYSAHDSTLARLMGALGIFDVIPPPYASALLMELHQDFQFGQIVEILYKNESGREPYQMVIPGCGQPCKLETLIKITKHLIPDDWESECSEPLNIFSRSFPSVTAVFILLCTFWALVMTLGIVMARQRKSTFEERFLIPNGSRYQSI